MPTHGTWDEITITPSLTYDTDFWIVIKLPPEGGPYEGIWTTSDDGIDYPGRSIKWGPSQYTSELNGDLCIRAVISYTGIEEKLSIPNGVALYQNSPNPVLNESTISYTIPEEMNVELKVYDITGKLVKTVVETKQKAGYYSVVWDMKDNTGKQLSSGIYFYRLETPKFTVTKKLIIMQ